MEFDPTTNTYNSHAGDVRADVRRLADSTLTRFYTDLGRADMPERRMMEEALFRAALTNATVRRSIETERRADRLRKREERARG